MLISLGVRVFYDENEVGDLLGVDLYQELAKIYHLFSRYCIVFVSKSYKIKQWPRHELKQMQARSFTSRDYLIPIRLDATAIVGINDTTGYIDGRLHDVQVCDLIVRKLFHGSALGHVS